LPAVWPDPLDERRHPPPADPSWCEVFDLTFRSPLATFGGHITVMLWPALGRCWYWTSVVQEGQPLVTIVETDIVLPRNGLELRAQGLWADHNCETPFRHWSYGLEAFALRLDEPDEALSGFRGERIGLGYDLEWEFGSQPPVRRPDGGYDHDGCVHGEVLVGADAFDLEGIGQRTHWWGTGLPWGSHIRPTGLPGPVTSRLVGRAVAVLPTPKGRLVVERQLQRADDAGWTVELRPDEARSA
jgi:hypothetical protein